MGCPLVVDPVASRRGRGNKQRGKRYERAALAVIETIIHTAGWFWRNPDTGYKVADIESVLHVVEVKSVQKHPPEPLRTALGQMDDAMKKTGKEGHVIIAYTPRGGRTRWLLITPIDDLPTEDEIALRRILATRA